jgi:glycosyltransferase involved in cell wall biosynthesis
MAPELPRQSHPPLSVVICTHNPRADYFARCLAALRAQSLPTAQWELVVVDNRSTEPLQGRLDLDWHPGAQLVREDTLGLTPARLRGIREASGEVLVFVDDDNVLGPDYLETTLRIAGERPFLGAWSGQCLPSFEQPPAAWTERYWGTLCIRRFETEVWSNLPRLPDTMPAGAGLCVRRPTAQRYLDLHTAGQRCFQLDRTGDSLISGGDNDLAACACDLGLGMGLIPDLKLEHLIAPERLTADYIERLVEGIEFSSVVLDASRGRPGAPRTRLGRALDRLRVARLRAPHNRILAAAYRGRERAARFLAGEVVAPEPG